MTSNYIKFYEPFRMGQCFEMLAHYAQTIFPEFRTKLTTLMESLHMHVDCGQKFEIDLSRINDREKYWEDPRFLRIVAKQLFGDNHYETGTVGESNYLKNHDTC